MRPLRLEVKGFTAFRDVVEIDFTVLDVFCISGSTGSGKSSLLDAMTYALYGRVERVGDRVAHLIAQGQPTMAVTLEFEVDKHRYRVTRRTPRKGATKIMVERQEGGDWVQAGEGADRVRDAERMLVGILGLNYDMFTRTILLPQGKFAEFLLGDPRKRRDILTELLELSLFRRMAERAGEIAKEAAIRAQTVAEVLEREFSDATPEALADARREAAEGRAREEALSTAAARVVEVLDRWKEQRGSAEELRACSNEARAAAAAAAAAGTELAELGDRVSRAVAEVDARDEAASAADAALAETRARLAEAEERSGSAEVLVGVQGHAHGLAQAGARLVELAAAEQAATAASGPLRAAAEEAARALEAATRALAERERDAAAAQAALEEAQHADLVVAVSAGLRAGDPCPVCGLPLERAPKAGGGGIERARKAHRAAAKAVEEARNAVTEAQRRVDGAARDVEEHAREATRFRTERAELEARSAELRESVAAVLGEPLPEDPGRAVESRLAELRGLERSEREAAEAAAAAAKASLEAGRALERLSAQAERVRDRLESDRGPILDRAARALGGPAPAALPDPPSSSEVPDLLRYAQALADALTAFADRLAAEADLRSSAERALLEEANAAVLGLVEPAVGLEELAGTVNAALRGATAGAAAAAQRAESLAERVAKRTELADEAATQGVRATVFRSLALELRADRLIAFLQAEALQVLAAAGSERLSGLTDGRYRIVCRDDDEFFVVDTWNGDEERSVRTLSGGETFLASLALALALADQVRSLSVTDRARLDSLFLDEGFGTLDQETLREVVEAIEQLGGDGRLVGVITHVQDLAEHFPRLEVRKSQRGSRLAFVA